MKDSLKVVLLFILSLTIVFLILTFVHNGYCKYGPNSFNFYDRQQQACPALNYNRDRGHHCMFHNKYRHHSMDYIEDLNTRCDKCDVDFNKSKNAKPYNKNMMDGRCCFCACDNKSKNVKSSTPMMVDTPKDNNKSTPVKKGKCGQGKCG